MRPRQYSEHVVTFIDILGFKELVKRESAESIGNMLGRLEKVTDSGEYERLVMGRRTIAFSDAIVRASALQTPSGDAARYGILFHELLNLVHAQVDLIVYHGVFLRGAVSIGLAFQEGTVIYGEGVIRAYETESELAIFPRIIIDPEVFRQYAVEGNLLKAHHHTVAQDSEYVGELVREDADGVWFVDYLKAVEPELKNDADYPRVLTAHRDAIIRASRGQGELNRVSQKYNWLARYHNQVVSELSDEYFVGHGARRDQFLITPAEMPSLTVLPKSSEPVG